jgi:hypothetical protein
MRSSCWSPPFQQGKRVIGTENIQANNRKINRAGSITPVKKYNPVVFIGIDKTTGYAGET